MSVVRGSLTEQRAKAMSARGRPVEAGTPYSAAALSLVFHPASPLVPTLRADVRLFQVGTVPPSPHCWRLAQHHSMRLAAWYAPCTTQELRIASQTVLTEVLCGSAGRILSLVWRRL